jgi:hypothetical protein
MYKLLTKYGQLMAFGLGLLVALLFLISVLGGIDSFNSLAEEEQGTTGIFNVGLYGAIAMCIICAVAILGFGLYHAISNPRGAMKFLIGFGALAVLFIIFYAMSAPIEEAEGRLGMILEKFSITEGTNKFITGALATTVTLAALAAAAFAFSEVRNLFK